MILNDWIRGKIPYFAPPPDIGIDEVFESKKKKDPIEIQPQNIDSLRVKENFFDTDDQPINENAIVNDNQEENDVAWDDVCPEDEEMIDNEAIGDNNNQEDENVDWETLKQEEDE